MRVQKIQLQGFKSFKDKTVLYFDEKITGIIGPNGCGKSNIVDALFWVMGEQSAKHLRGAQMQDVIFNGSSQYGPAAFAEVMLTLSNPDKKALILGPKSFIPEEIEVSRKLYRNGESEYRINNILCRLKDVQELFLGTGAGAKSYSIIAQGEIEKLIGSKPIERKEMFDEIAGIAKYKIRKRESQKKIEAAEINLRELSSLIKELEKNHKHQLQQAELVKKAQVIKEKIQATKLHSIAHEAYKIYSSLEDLLQENSSFQEELEKLSFHRDTSILDLEKIKLEEDEFKKTFEQSSRSLEEKKKNLQKIQENIALHKKSLEEKKNLEEHLVKNLSEEDERKASKEKILKEFSFIEEASFEPLIQKKATYEKELDSLLKNKNKIQSDYFELKNFLEKEEPLLKEEEKEIQQLSFFLKEKKLVLSSLTKDLENFQEESDLTQLEESYLEVQDKLESSLKILEKEKKSLQGNLEHLNSLRKELEDLSLNVKKTELALDQVKHLSPKDLTFYIENPLFENLDLTYAEEILLKDILYVSTSFLAKDNENTTFFHEGISKKKKKLQALKSFPTFFIAQDLTEENYQDFCLTEIDRLVNSTGSVVIKKIAPEKFQVFFLKKKESSLEEFKKNLTLLKKDLHDLEKKETSLQKELQQEEELLQEKRELLKKAEENHRLLERSFLEKQIFFEQKKEEIKKNKSQKEENEKQFKILSQEIEDKEKLFEKKQKYFSSKEIIFEEKKSSFPSIDQEYRSLEKQEVFLHHEIKNLNQELLHLKRQKEQQEEYYQSLKEELDNFENKKKEKEKNLLEHQQSIKNLLTQIQQEEVLEKETLKALQPLEKNLQKEHNELQDFLNKKKLQEDKIKELEKSIYALDKNFLEKKIKIEHLTEEESKKVLEFYNFSEKNLRLSFKNFFSEKTFHLLLPLNLSADYLEIELKEVQQTPKEDLSKLEKDLSKMGDLNWQAPEEVKKISKRLDFLKSEENILQTSLHDLHEAITEMDQLAQERFKKTFEEVNDRFQKVFPLVFNGGEAKLVLEKEDQEEGIHIYARPPGKKMQNIRLMSGGEKALTAISLIFSIFLVKPSPFCLLDEVDAPLDDANVARFNELLKEMSSESQFIVVTHNKKTMEINRKLYGITMQEPGVSKSFSVDLQ